MTKLGPIRFWHLMVGIGFGLLVIGLVMILLPPEIGNSDPFLIEFFEASIEGTEMGLALIVLGLSCFLIGRKDLSDLRAYQDLQRDLEQAGQLTARLVAEQVNSTVAGIPVQPAHLGTLPDLDVEEILGRLTEIEREGGNGIGLASSLDWAEKGLSLLQAFNKEELHI